MRSHFDTSPEAHPMPSVNGWRFVPLLFFMEGLPYVAVNALGLLMFKSLSLHRPELHISNGFIAFWTTLVTVPWTIKMLWGPLVDLTLTKRRWVLLMQTLLIPAFVALAYTAQLPNFATAALTAMLIMAFLSATHDVAADGLYLLSLDREKQAAFVGVQSTFYRLATLFGAGYLVKVAGRMEPSPGGDVTRNISDFAPYAAHDRFLYRINDALAPWIADPLPRAWTQGILMGAAVYAVGWILSSVLLPHARGDRAIDAPIREGEARLPFLRALEEFFRQDKIGWILGFILFYRFGESMISKVSGLFLKDPRANGGLGLSTESIGEITGVFGVIALTVGGLLGGFLISKFGIKRCLWPMVLAINIPNFFYVYAAATQAGPEFAKVLITIDQFGYGFGFTAYMVYLMFVSQKSVYRTSTYAVATGLMALGALVAGSISGYLQDRMGWTAFFATVCALGIPGMITLFFIPLQGEDIYDAPPVE